MKLVPTRRLDQSIQILMFLASSEGGHSSTESISAVTGIGPVAIRRLMQALGRAELISSISGPRGGYRLSCSPSDIDMRIVTEACEGPINPNFCVLNGISCGNVSHCALHLLWSTAQDGLGHTLARISLADVIESSRR